MPYVPPWLNVQPSDFVQAAQGGARIGAELAGQASERGIAAGRNATALQEAQMRENTALSGQQAEASLAGARLTDEQQQKEAERRLRQWEIQQQMIHNQAVIDSENSRSQGAITSENLRNQRTIDAANTRAAAALDERQKYGTSMLDIRREANRIAEERAKAAAAKPSSSDYTTVSEHTKEVPDAKNYTITDPGKDSHIFGLFKGIPPSTLQTTNAADLANIPTRDTISTNTIPGTGIPSRTITRRVPVGGDPYKMPFQGSQIPTPPPAHVNYLVANPTPAVVSDFNAKYGEGAADQYLNPDSGDVSQADMQ